VPKAFFQQLGPSWSRAVVLGLVCCGITARERFPEYHLLMRWPCLLTCPLMLPFSRCPRPAAALASAAGWLQMQRTAMSRCGAPHQHSVAGQYDCLCTYL